MSVAAGKYTIIFSAEAADGDSSVFNVAPENTLWIGGTFDGATVTLKSRPTGSGAAFINVPDAAFTAGTQQQLRNNVGIDYKLTISSAGTTAIDAVII